MLKLACDDNDESPNSLGNGEVIMKKVFRLLI